MMSFLMHMLALMVGSALGLFIINRVRLLINLRELREIDDCPFKFVPKNSDNIIVDLCKDATLWCDYGLGIRSDGIYGIDKIRLLGINGPYSEINNLKIGQSVFPIISAMDQFLTWAKTKPFKTEFKDGFELEWNAMKKNLDNLRYLESELKKKEKKAK